MERTRLKTTVGLAMVGLGFVQATLFGLQSDWVATGFGLAYAVIGMLFLWAEVYTAGQ